jgi:hypothetical protein
MSLSSTSAIKNQLNAALAQKAQGYFETLSQFVSGKISRTEFDESVRQALDAPNLGWCNHFSKHRGTDITLVQLHNSLIISLFDFTVHRRPPTPPPDVAKPPPRKRRRTLPYQGPDDRDDTLRSSRLKRWTVSMGRRERDRIRTLQNNPTERPRPRKETDEIACDRGVVLLNERGGTRSSLVHSDDR